MAFNEGLHRKATTCHFFCAYVRIVQNLSKFAFSRIYFCTNINHYGKRPTKRTDKFGC